MPYDPSFPPDGVLIESLPFRNQFHGLKDLIDAVPTISSAVVDAVNTLPAGDPASVGVTITDGVLHLTFGIPEGQNGPPGEVTLAQLDAATAATLSLTSSNSNAVAVLGEIADSSYSQPQMQNLINKMDELILALRR